jgi:hypothetical protein
MATWAVVVVGGRDGKRWDDPKHKGHAVNTAITQYVQSWDPTFDPTFGGLYPTPPGQDPEPHGQLGITLDPKDAMTFPTRGQAQAFIARTDPGLKLHVLDVVQVA